MLSVGLVSPAAVALAMLVTLAPAMPGSTVPVTVIVTSWESGGSSGKSDAGSTTSGVHVTVCTTMPQVPEEDVAPSGTRPGGRVSTTGASNAIDGPVLRSVSV